MLRKACFPNGAVCCFDCRRMLEYDCNPNPLRDELLVETPRLVDHMVSVPDRPGLGIDINHDVLNRFTVDHRATS